jgi:hypothetical protein
MKPFDPRLIAAAELAFIGLMLLLVSSVPWWIGAGLVVCSVASSAAIVTSCWRSRQAASAARKGRAAV